MYQISLFGLESEYCYKNVDLKRCSKAWQASMISRDLRAATQSLFQMSSNDRPQDVSLFMQFEIKICRFVCVEWIVEEILSYFCLTFKKNDRDIISLKN